MVCCVNKTTEVSVRTFPEVYGVFYHPKEKRIHTQNNPDIAVGNLPAFFSLLTFQRIKANLRSVARATTAKTRSGPFELRMVLFSRCWRAALVKG